MSNLDDLARAYAAEPTRANLERLAEVAWPEALSFAASRLARYRIERRRLEPEDFASLAVIKALDAAGRGVEFKAALLRATQCDVVTAIRRDRIKTVSLSGESCKGLVALLGVG